MDCERDAFDEPPLPAGNLLEAKQAKVVARELLAAGPEGLREAAEGALGEPGELPQAPGEPGEPSEEALAGEAGELAEEVQPGELAVAGRGRPSGRHKPGARKGLSAKHREEFESYKADSAKMQQAQKEADKKRAQLQKLKLQCDHLQWGSAW
jgi:hypothetical protein